jgi:Histone deacetylase domain
LDGHCKTFLLHCNILETGFYMQAFHSEHFTLSLPPGHRFPMGKYGLLREAVQRELPALRVHEAQAATDGELALVHTPPYVAAVADGLLSAAQQREIGFPWSARLAERARRSVGGTIAAARAALAEGLGANLAGGTHHAYADRGSGYCVFNDVAVAARLMQAEAHRRQRTLLRVLVIDLDVHQGNGTAAIFLDDPTARREELPGAQGKQRSRRRTARRLRRCRLPVGAGCSAGRNLAPPWRAGAATRLLPGRRRPARGRPPGPTEAQLRRLGRARPPRLRHAARASHSCCGVDGRRLRPADRGHGGGAPAHAG